jgi:hypothetical protein
LKGDIFRTWETADGGIWSGGNDQPDRLIVRERERERKNKQMEKKRNKKETRRMKGEDDDDDKEKGKECTQMTHTYTPTV